MSLPQKIVLVGQDGQLARALIRAWSDPAAGLDLVVLARPTYDLLHPAELSDAIIAAKPTLVVNAAAYTAVDKAEDEPAVAHAINAVAPGVLAAAAAHVGAPILHVSTDYVFDGTQRRPYVETDAVRAEIVAARRLFEREGWPVIDVTRRSVEETAAAVMNIISGGVGHVELLG